MYSDSEPRRYAEHGPHSRNHSNVTLALSHAYELPSNVNDLDTRTYTSSTTQPSTPDNFLIPKMSTFGAPGTGVKIGRPNPPAKGSFPLDHDAECQPLMKQYLRCLKTARGVNSPECRELSKNYLSCRMERGLMAPDEMKNLGYGEGQTATDDIGKGIKK